MGTFFFHPEIACIYSQEFHFSPLLVYQNRSFRKLESSAILATKNSSQIWVIKTLLR